MIIRGVFLQVVAPLLLLTGTAFADQMHFDSAGANQWYNFLVSPYQASDLTNTQNNPLSIYCDDWNTDFSGNPTWDATVLQLNLSNLSSFKYGNTTSSYNVLDVGHSLTKVLSDPLTPSAYNRYVEAAWLFDQSQNAQGDTTLERQYNAAAWTLFANGTNGANMDALLADINGSGYADAVYGDLVNAQNAVASGAFTGAGWWVITPTPDPYGMQEFMTKGFNSPVPEPASVLLLVSVAGLTAFVGYRRKQRA